MNEQPYTKKILLVEDSDQFYTPISRWLNEAGYRVRLATTYSEALSALEAEHFHLAIVDIKLGEGEDNEEGLQLIADMQHMNLSELPCIVLTAYPNMERVWRAWQELRVSRFIDKTSGYRRQLLNAVEELFDGEVKINFDLDYIGGSEQIFNEVAQDVAWKTGEKPPLTLLTPQVQDLFGKLFQDADRVFLSKLKPGLAGAAVVRAQPSYAAGGMGRSYVVKVGRRDKVETESDQYQENVKRFLPANTVGQMGVAYSRHLGGLLYSFAENERSVLQEMDEFYQGAAPEEIIESLHGLFKDTCHNWYDARVRDRSDLPQLYYDALQLDAKKLISRIQVVVPHLDPQAETFRFTPDSPPVLNPIAWLNRHRDECVLPVYQCITHGDLTGRNVMVDETGKCWLIDFYRTEKSHILRDFVILETDIKYRLLAGMKTLDFLKLEKALLDADRSGLPPELGPEAGQDVLKAAKVVHELRRMAYEFARSIHSDLAELRREHLISLLMATLNVARLRHVDEGRKIQAMHSAVLICAELDKLAGRQRSQTIFDVYMQQKRSDSFWAPEDSGFFAPALALATAQQRFLAELLVEGKVTLFLGTAVPNGVRWPNAHHLAKQLMKEIDYGMGDGEKPAKLFAYYLNKMGDREKLLAKNQAYYENQKRPNFFRRVARLHWQAIYTTNQHCYLEEAYQARQRPYQTVSLGDTAVTALPDVSLIYKMHGSLDRAALDSSPAALPMTEYDYRDRLTRDSIQHFWAQLGQSLNSGTSLLMLCATEDEIDKIYDEYRPADNAGLIWIAGGDFSEQEQDVYRNLDLRVLPDHPAELLTILYTLLSVEGHLKV